MNSKAIVLGLCALGFVANSVAQGTLFTYQQGPETPQESRFKNKSKKYTTTYVTEERGERPGARREKKKKKIPSVTANNSVPFQEKLEQQQTGSYVERNREWVYNPMRYNVPGSRRRLPVTADYKARGNSTKRRR